MHIRLVNVYLLNVPSVSSPYFNKTKRTSHLGNWHALSLEIRSDITCLENSVDPNQLASEKPADQDTHCFLI